MEKLKYYLSVFTGKAIYFLLKLLSSGATAAPGLYALKIYPQLVKKLSSTLKHSIVITGTNGKTTTARLISSTLKQTNISFIHNRTGSNLLRGIASQLLKAKKLGGNFSEFIGLWEVDEAVLPHALSQIKPKTVVILNLFRDQLDRYGEINTVLKKWQAAIEKLPITTTLILNADDPNIANLGKNAKCRIFYFGIKDKSKSKKTLTHAADAIYCPVCFNSLKYKAGFVSHLGIYSCPKCRKIQPEPQIAAEKISFLNNQKLKLNIKVQNTVLSLKINLIGLYNSYNVLAALACLTSLNINPKTIKKGFSRFKPAFGRFESIKTEDNKTLKIMLVKNPTSFNQVIEVLPSLTNKKNYSCLLILNDLIADGRDVSWIWDVDFSKLKQKKLKKILVSGIRAEDMALRLKYANISKNKKIKVVLRFDIKKSVEKLLSLKQKNLFILPTYTAMLNVRKILYKKGLVHQTWED